MSCTCVMSERPTYHSLRDCADHKSLHVPMVVCLARELNAATPEGRLKILDTLREHSTFCWHCGYDDGGKTCHCENDE